MVGRQWPLKACSIATIGWFNGPKRQKFIGLKRQTHWPQKADSLAPKGRFIGPKRQIHWPQKADSMAPKGRFNGPKRQIFNGPNRQLARNWLKIAQH